MRPHHGTVSIFTIFSIIAIFSIFAIAYLLTCSIITIYDPTVFLSISIILRISLYFFPFLVYTFYSAKPQYRTRVQGSVITLLEVITKVLAPNTTNRCITTLVKLETRTSCGNPLQRQKELDLVDLVSKASNERRHDPDKEHFMHQKPPYLDKEHFGSQTLTPKLPN